MSPGTGIRPKLGIRSTGIGGPACAAVALALCLAQPAAAQTENAWSVYESIQGSFNSAGQIFRVDTSLSYQLTGHFRIGGGVPLYLVRASNGADPPGPGWNAGLGNAYLDLELSTSRSDWYVSSLITATAPTGDRDRGFSTGKVSVDWTNSAAVYLPAATLFAGAGVANTVSDTAFFVRPFSTTGLVGHFDAGIFVPLNPWLGVGALGYAVAGGGEQQVRSRLVQTDRTSGTDLRRGFETTVETRGQDLADDRGFSAWLDIAGASETSFQVGYTRSVPYAYDTAFVSVGFDILKLVGR